MGLTATLSNALSGMGVTQSGLEILSRNVANSGVAGYHVQRQNPVENAGTNSSSVRATQVNRAFDQSLQNYYTKEVSDGGYAEARSDIITRLETYLGKPGDKGSLDALYAGFESSLEALATSPDSYATRASVLNAAGGLSDRLNSLSTSVQNLRQDTENQMRDLVNGLNSNLTNLSDINQRLINSSQDDAARAALLDERDRLTSAISETIDVNVTYRTDGTVRLMTRAGVGILDVGVSTFNFSDSGKLAANSLFSSDSTKSGVGELSLRTPAGLTLDLVGQRVLQSGRLAGLVEMRDQTLVQAQSQLDDIAASMALAMSNVTTQGTSVVSGAANGFEIDLSNVQKGNSFLLDYVEGGTAKTVKVVRVDDTSKLPMDSTGPDGVRTIGLDFSGGIGAVAASLDTTLGAAIVVSNPAGNILRVVDDGAGATSDISSLGATFTATGTQDGTLALPLFVDVSNGAFTDSLDAGTQRLGFAARISLNSAVVQDNSLVVQYSATSSLGDAGRANYILDQMRQSTFSGAVTSTKSMGRNQLTGSVGSMVTQMLSYQGASTESTQAAQSTRELTLETLNTRMKDKYGVNVDKEMALLVELQTAYAANARVLSTVQQLINTLMKI
ncbi:Flagellar hook-associated protein FlgK [hydrothermal vent metagenome]|uniref:Flagellar hook-associated protein FlgK n=1 Tax=hydrothermal vent metagenome TaxID=652676 RepID=A0A3B0TUA8_9ZZZZ